MNPFQPKSTFHLKNQSFDLIFIVNQIDRFLCEMHNCTKLGYLVRVRLKSSTCWLNVCDYLRDLVPFVNWYNKL